jgi:hypothetical protein
LAKKRDDWLSVVLQVLAIAVPIIVAGIIGYLSLSERLAKLEGQVDLLKEIIIKQVVTQTITSTTTTTATSTPSAGIPGFPLESIILGLALGIFVLLLTRREGWHSSVRNHGLR